MRRKVALLGVFALMTGSMMFIQAGSSGVLATAPPAKPNVVFIVSDDQSADSLAAMQYLTSKPGGHWFEFTNAFDNTPLCCPSRATLLTGLYPHHHGVEGNTGGGFDDSSTIATWLQSAGYRTGLAGKYLNDYPFGSSFVPPGWDDWFANVGTTGHYNYTMNDNGTNVAFGAAESDYHTDVVARRADEFIRGSAGEEPFFLYVAPVAPHPPLVPPPRYAKTRITVTRPPNFNEADVSDKPAWIQSTPLMTSQEAAQQDSKRAKEYRMVMAVDDLIRTVRQALADSGELDNTVIIFQTDNGVMFGEHRQSEKGCVYEECVGTPMFIRVPWLDGRVDSRLVSSIDIAPTISDIAGIAPPDPVDGTSLLPLLEDADSPWRSSILLEHHAGTPKPDFWAIRTQQWKYVELATGERELYDEVGDPFELQNVADAPEHAALQAQLAAELAGLRTAPPHDVFPAVSISDARVNEGHEGSALLEFTLDLSVASLEGASVRASTVDGTATSPEDYQSAVETFTFAPEETRKTFLVTVNGDGSIEADETIGVVLDQLQSVSLADGEATGTITDDDDAPTVSAGDVAVVEGNDGSADATFTLSLSHASGATASVAYTTADGSALAPDDYEATSGEATFDPGQTQQTVTVRVSGDQLIEPDETFTLELSDPSGALLGDASGTALILDDDVPLMAAIDDVVVTEGNTGTTAATFTVSLTPASTGPVVISWSTADGTATAPGDYAASSGNLTFSPGENAKTITVPVAGDVLYEAQEDFFVNLTSTDVDLADAQGRGSINDDDIAPAIAITDVSVNEGTGPSVFATFVVTLSGSSGLPVSVSYASANGTAKAPGDYIAVTGTLVFAPGETSKTIQVSVVGDSTAERTENFYLNLSDQSGATLSDSQGRCSILSDD
jgi:arylsulfatase A-like enzyme